MARYALSQKKRKLLLDASNTAEEVASMLACLSASYKGPDEWDDDDHEALYFAAREVVEAIVGVFPKLKWLEEEEQSHV